MAIQHNMLSTHIVCIAIHLLITDTFSTPTPHITSSRLRHVVLSRLELWIEQGGKYIRHIAG
jgi:hypothetical protein